MRKRPFVIGVVHLLPLPGSPKYEGSIQKVLDRALKDAESLIKGGVDGIIIENFNDAPFFKNRILPETFATFSIIAWEIKKILPSEKMMGINILRNDGLSALSIAHTIDADFIRINIPIGAMLTPSGLIETEISYITRKRWELKSNVKFFEDVSVKHAWHIGDEDFREIVIETEHRGMADALIITGRRTGTPTGIEYVKLASSLSSLPIIIGSGVNIENFKAYLPYADGFIIGTYFEKDNIPGNPVEYERVARFMEEIFRICKDG